MKLPSSEQWLLMRYFGQDQTVFQRSTAGATLANAKMFGRLRPEHVHHAAELKDATEHDRGEYVSLSTKYPAARWPKVAQGKILYDDREITARITAESQAASTRELDDEMHKTLRRMGKVSKRLDTLAASSPDGPAYCAALRIYFGPEGDKYAVAAFDTDGKEAVSGVDRLVSIFPLLEGGREMLRVARADDRAAAKKHGQPVRVWKDHELLRRIVLSAQAGQCSEEQRLALAMCRAQAGEIMGEAVRHWMGTGES